MRNLYTVSALALLFLILSCSASTGSRYEDKTENGKEVTTVEDQNKEVQEDFDITPYKTTVEIEEINPVNQFPSSDIWYSYEDSVASTSKNIIGTTDGYRVQVISTDDLDIANQTRSEIYFKSNNKEVYINFEPPFYKVKVGDFTSRSEAEDLMFMFNQLGYNESRVVKETVNLFE